MSRQSTQRYKYCSDDGVGRPEHIVIWEKANGQLPDGYVIHHIDGNGHNNELSNLVAMSRGDHAALHARMRREGTDPVDSTDPKVIKYREAVRAAGKRYRANHRDEIHERDRLYREQHHEELTRKARERYAINKETKREYVRTHKDAIRANAKRYREEHLEELKASQQAYYQANKDSILIKAKIRYDRNHDDILAQKRKHHMENRDTINERNRQYRKDHLDKMRARDRERVARTGELKNARQRLQKAIHNNWPEEVIEARKKEVESIRCRLIADGKLDPRFSNRK